MQAEVGPGGAGVMHTPDWMPVDGGGSVRFVNLPCMCHGEEVLPVGVQVKGLGHVGVPDMAHGVHDTGGGDGEEVGGGV